MIVVVARDADFTSVLKAQASKRGEQTLCVSSPEEAKLIVGSVSPRVLIFNLDAAEPASERQQLLDAARAKGVDVLFVGSPQHSALAAELKDAGWQHFVNLPCPASAFFEAIGKLSDGDEESDPLLGREIGPPGQEVRLTKHLGRGGMGEVYQGFQESLGRDVAVKFVTETTPDRSSDLRGRFVAEARAIARMRSNHVVAVHFIGELDGRPYSVMELLPGPTLQGFLQEKKQLSEVDAVRACRQVLAGLAEVHRHDRVHRDIKPANIMLNDRGELVILDFGLVRSTDGMDQSFTQTGAVMGTPRYLSPEQAKGETADARADLYSAGIILFELLTGKPPFTAPEYTGVLMKHVAEPLPSLHSFGVSVAPEVDALLRALCAKSPEDRPQTAEAAIELADACLGSPSQPSAGAAPLSTLPAGVASPVSEPDLRAALDPLSGALIDGSGTLTHSFGDSSSAVAMSVRSFSELLAQLTSLDDLGELERIHASASTSKMAVVPMDGGLGGLQSRASGASERLAGSGVDALRALVAPPGSSHGR